MSGTFPDELCGVGYCSATFAGGNPDLVAPCGTGSCCDFGERPLCTPKPTLHPTPVPSNKVLTVTISGVSYPVETTTELRALPASPTRRGARLPLASQGEQRDLRPDPDRDRMAHGADKPASSPRVPDARRGARSPLAAQEA